MDRPRTVITLLLMALVGAVWAYRDVWAIGLVYEDERWLSGIWGPLEWTVPSRALTTLTVRWTLPVLPWAHAFNVGVHVMNGVLVFLLASGMLRPSVAVAVATVFLWHPLNVEAVAYLYGRADLLVTTGLLLTAIGMRSERWPVAALGIAVALTTKETGLTALPLAVLCWRGSRVALGLLLLAGVGVVAGLPFVRWAGMPSLPWWAFAPVQSGALLQILTNAIWPAHLSIDHDALTVAPWVRVLAVVGLAAWAAAVWRWQSSPLWLLAAWPLLMVAPRFALYHVETINERQLYPAMVGVSFLLVVGLVRCVDVARGYAAFTQYQPFTGWTVLEGRTTT